MDSLPDLHWIKDVLPDDKQLKIIQDSLNSIFDDMKNVNLGKIKRLITFTMEELKSVISLRYLC
jgi:hypothetical protein